MTRRGNAIALPIPAAGIASPATVQHRGATAALRRRIDTFQCIFSERSIKQSKIWYDLVLLRNAANYGSRTQGEHNYGYCNA